MVSKKRTDKKDNDEAIKEATERGIAQILPSREEFLERLRSGPLTIYIGVDATGPDLHLGHATNFLILERLRRLGHKIIVLFGDFTAMIGDPTDKDAARTVLGREDVVRNISTWRGQVLKTLNLDDPENPVEIRRNSEWHDTLGFGDVLNLASRFTVQQMIERDMFERRIEAGKPVYVSEFLYPLMQGYDSVALDVDAEIGGTDQTFNMLAGRTLQKQIHNKEKFVITTTLLAHPHTGKKLMSKSEGGYIALTDPPPEMFGKIMALPDEVIVQIFTDCTTTPLARVHDIEQRLREGMNPRDAKIELARELVSSYHNQDSADAAERDFISAFQQGNSPQNAPEVEVPQGTPLLAVLVESGTVSSRAEARRLIESGAVSIVSQGKITDSSFSVVGAGVVRIGKHRFLKIVMRP